MTPAQFIAKWSKSTLGEKQAAQQHFLDLCHLFDHPSPADAEPTGSWYCRPTSTTSDPPGWPTDLTDEQILQRLLNLKSGANDTSVVATPLCQRAAVCFVLTDPAPRLSGAATTHSLIHAFENCGCGSADWSYAEAMTDLRSSFSELIRLADCLHRRG